MIMVRKPTYCMIAIVLMGSFSIAQTIPSRAVVRYDLSMMGGKFPPGINSADPASDLQINESPDAYGYSIDMDGLLAKNTTMPTGLVRIARNVTIASTNYNWYYRRLWRFSGTTLEYYAQDYDDVLVKQKLSKLFFNESSDPIIEIVPFAPDNVCIAKTNGSFVIGNVSDNRALFNRTDLIQELRCTQTNFITELDGQLFVSNTKGLMSFSQGSSVELTRKVRNNLSSFVSLPLTLDYEKKRVIATSATANTGFIYEPSTSKLFRWNGTAFRYTTPQFHLPDWAPFLPDRLVFTIANGNKKNGSLKYQVKYEDDDWGRVQTMLLKYQPGDYTVISDDLAAPMSVHKFQLRLTDITTNKFIKEIRVDLKDFSIDDYSQ